MEWMTRACLWILRCQISPPIDMAAHRRKDLNMKPGGWGVVHLGTSSAVPTRTRNVSSTAMVMKPNAAAEGSEGPSMFLVDAGETTDDQLIRCDWCMTHGFRRDGSRRSRKV